MERLISYLEEIKCEYETDVPMSSKTTFKIGGPARLVVYPDSEEKASLIVKKTNELGIRLIAVGNGSNLLVDDGGIDACVMVFDEHFAGIKLIGEDVIYAQSGALLIRVCRFALEHGLSGLEFAYGIPGSCGGAAFMNAGAYGGEMRDVLYRCNHIDSNGDIGYIENEMLNLSYRHSAYYDNGCIITGIYLKLKKAPKEEIKSKMDDLLQRRKDKQPLEYPSAGSTFKRPANAFAGALIEQCGLKGKSVGGAQVSEKHAGFVVNRGGATCSDVLELCEHIRKTVLEETGFELEMEIRVTR